MTVHGPPLDPDFSVQVLEDLYTYRRKRRWVAWLLWGTLGLLGVHRFYLERPFTGVLQLFTGGGVLAWWLIDAGAINRMVREHNREQEAREKTGRPPVEMAGMPPLDERKLDETPDWVKAWHRRGRTRRWLRLGGDLLVLLAAGMALGTMIGEPGALEAVFAVVVLCGMISLGAGPDWLDDVPGFRALTRWTHRLRLYYYYNEPASPLGLLVRSGLGILWAPFRRKARVEVRLYVELGAGFSAVFLLLDVVPGVLVPLISGAGLPGLGALAGNWLGQVFMTFLLTYLFAAPVGGVLTLYLLTRPRHTLPRILALFTLGAIVMGVLAGNG